MHELMHNFAQANKCNATARMHARHTPPWHCAVILMSDLCCAAALSWPTSCLCRGLCWLSGPGCTSIKCHVSADGVFSEPLSIMSCNIVKACARPVPTLVYACVWLCASFPPSALRPHRSRTLKEPHSLLFYSYFYVFILLYKATFLPLFLPSLLICFNFLFCFSSL